ncbi:MAG: DUF4143 domain-containing protein, partial [Bifidobacteriaceae bacterium]|nr:DUF4143 domain-containing protein [Bifidobacteriaceae bacterium]
AKGVGKTATASRFAATTIELDNPDQAELAIVHPTRLRTAKPPVLLDEWQRAPRIWDLVRRAVDAGAPAGSFILTGSATPSAPSHSGAGRIVRVRLRPMGLSERAVETPSVSFAELISDRPARLEGETGIGLEQYVDEILASGFPGIRAVAGRNRERALDGYLHAIVEHDFAELGHVVRRPEALKAWLTAFAAATGGTARYEAILDAATSGISDKPSRGATIAYRDALARLWVLDQLPAWLPTRNRLAALTQAPKHFLADPALAAALLGVDAQQLTERPRPGKIAVRDGTLLGALFEHLAVLSVRALAGPSGARAGHLRTKGGEHEVDLVVERRDGRVLAIEVKLAPAPSAADVANLVWLKRRLGPDVVDAVVLTTGPMAYRRPDGIGVVPLALLGA